jgi:hypothetical protein
MYAPARPQTVAPSVPSNQHVMLLRDSHILTFSTCLDSIHIIY